MEYMIIRSRAELFRGGADTAEIIQKGFYDIYKTPKPEFEGCYIRITRYENTDPQR